MVDALSPDTLSRIKASAPALRAHGVEITTRMYERLFVDPELRALFDSAAMVSGEQPRRLAAAILAYAENIDRLDALTGAVERMAMRHVQSGVRPEHYPAVAAALLGAIRDVLGAAADEATLDAWAVAYGFLAGVLQAREAELRRERD